MIAVPSYLLCLSILRFHSIMFLHNIPIERVDAFCFLTQSVACQCEPVEEGRSFTLPCGGGACNSSALTTWTAQDVGDGSNRLISTCDTTLNCTGNNEFFTIKIARNGEGYQSNLTIHKVSLSQPFNNERNWRCNYCGTELGTCSLIIYGTRYITLLIFVTQFI